MIFLGRDILVQIFKYLNNITDLKSIKNTCSLLYNIKHIINFPINTTMHENIISTHITTKNIDGVKYNLSYITTLDIRNIKVKFKGLNNLQYLWCKFIYAESIRKCTELIGIYCTTVQNHLQNASFAHLKKLKYLYCPGSQFTDKLLQYLTNLQQLEIYEKSKFTENGYRQLPYLQHIETNKKRLIIPYMLQIVPALTIIRCSENYNFNDSHILNCIKAQELYDTPRCTFTDLSIANLTYLKILDVRHQLLISDRSLQYLIHLEVLFCPETINGSSLLHMPNLKKLYCLHNTNINDDIIAKLDLQELDCYWNRFITSKSIKTQKNLEYIRCNFVIKEHAFKKLNKLKIINIGSNSSFSEKFFIKNPNIIYELPNRFENVLLKNKLKITHPHIKFIII